MIQPWFHQAHESELHRIKPLAKLELHECCKRNLVPWRLGRLSLMTRNRIKSIIESHLPNLLSDIWRLMTSCVVLFFKAHGFLLTCNFFYCWNVYLLKFPTLIFLHNDCHFSILFHTVLHILYFPHCRIRWEAGIATSIWSCPSCQTDPNQLSDPFGDPRCPKGWLP